MTTGRINLLPPERIELLTRDYLRRVAGMVLGMIAILALVASVLLVPTYIFLTDSLASNQEQLVKIEASLPSSDDQELPARLTALSNTTASIVALKDVPSASAVARNVLAVGRTGIALTSLSYTRGQGAKPSTVILSGSAASRNVLRDYQAALEGLAGIHSATLPVSAYAKDADIAFTITLTL